MEDTQAALENVVLTTHVAGESFPGLFVCWTEVNGRQAAAFEALSGGVEIHELGVDFKNDD